MKKIISMLMIVLSLVTFAGCQKAASKTNAEETKKPQQEKQDKQDKQEVTNKDGMQQKDKLDAEKIVTSNFGKNDAQFDFKLKTTKTFLSDYDKICALLDSRYGTDGAEGAAPDGFVKAGTQSQLKYSIVINNDDEDAYKYIKRVEYGLFFNDDSKDKLTFSELNLTLCDEDKDGKIELNDKAKNILKVVYPKINLEEAQKKINQAIEAEKNKNYDSIRSDSDDKYCSIDFDWFRYKDNPVEVKIRIQQYQDYPR
ncbi:lipoprotein [Inconstantimicrobium mannanitabidum]|uniref:Uncharacterized protein n=1 Tax=Inconstantimicrobium mannanitabidum TaxID=1604901 RepID=A0ACB5RF92_9CLOT|nr:hypothetical protein [Clostridium sp. TW13]GKX67674.1 hypothetical protein rsdtw13_29320 [Clostridium sp. TW13]